MTALIKYDAACRAIAEAHAVDEVKDIRDRVDALRHYARQARNRESEIQWAECRFRAERRIGEIKRAMRDAGELHEGGRPAKTSAQNTEVSKVRLSDLGIDDHLSRRADRLAAVEPNSFERLVARWRAYQERETNRVSLNLLKEENDAKRKADHAAQTYTGGKVRDLHLMIEEGCKFAAILADPPWHFMARSEKGEGRSAGQHYTTDRLGEITSLPVAELAADDCVLFMWMVDWCPGLALDVIEAWGFAHKTTAFTWAKQNQSGEGWHMGQGYWTRANPEDCWLATRGHPKRINADVRQLVVAPITEHSRKPDEFYDHIERLVGGPYLELYARRERKGWITWGNELAFKMPLPPHDPATGELIESEAQRDDLKPKAPSDDESRTSAEESHECGFGPPESVMPTRAAILIEGTPQ
jgi:N6-adenosine-specific RNA methylase IME4